jgi:hypothetical protein
MECQPRRYNQHFLPSLLLFASSTLASAGVQCAPQRDKVHNVKPGRQEKAHCLLLIQDRARWVFLVISISHANGDSCHLVADCVPSFVRSAGQKARQALAGRSSRRFLGGRPNPTAFDSISQSRKTSFLSRPHYRLYPPLSSPPYVYLPIFVASVRSTHHKHTASNMSSEQVIEQLRSHINSLESRVHELEGKYGKPDTGAKSAVDGMRMILIGPPGAGTYIFASVQWLRMRLTSP